jgi:hypothetical protein
MKAQTKLNKIAMDLVKIDLQMIEMRTNLENAREQLNEFAEAVSNYTNNKN